MVTEKRVKLVAIYIYIISSQRKPWFPMQHGRLKVKTTEEQAEAKRLERLKKQKLYQGATAKIFEKVCAITGLVN